MPTPFEELRLSVSNDLPHEVRFIIEPWGQDCVMPAMTKFEVVSHGPAGGSFEWSKSDAGDITVYAPFGSVVRLFGPSGEFSQDWGCSQHAPPELPPGVSMSGFIEALFGRR